MKVLLLSQDNPYDLGNWSGTPYFLTKKLVEKGYLSTARSLNISPVSKLLSLDLKRTIKYRKPVSNLRYSSLFDKVIRKRFIELDKNPQWDVVLEIGDLGHFPHTPFFIYLDMDYDTLIRYYENNGRPAPGFEFLEVNDLKKLRDRQHRLFRKAAGVFTMSNYIRESILDTGILKANQVHAVGAGYNFPDFEGPWRSEESYSSKNILFVGKDFRLKGGELLLEAFRILKSKDSSVSLTIAGPKEPIEGSGIKWLGFVDKNTLAKLYREAAVFCMPSKFECFGIVFIEAMQMGLPVIGANRMAMAEFIEPGINGELLFHETPEALAGLLGELLNNPKKLMVMGEASRNTAKAYTWSRVVECIISGMRAALD